MNQDDYQLACKIVQRIEFSDRDILDHQSLKLVLKAFRWVQEIAIEYATSKKAELTRSVLLPEGTRILTLKDVEPKPRSEK